MKLNVTTNQGTLLGTVDALETWNLDKPMGRAGFMDEIQGIVRAGAKAAEAEGEYVPTWSEQVRDAPRPRDREPTCRCGAPITAAQDAANGGLCEKCADESDGPGDSYFDVGRMGPVDQMVHDRNVKEGRA